MKRLFILSCSLLICTVCIFGNVNRVEASSYSLSEAKSFMSDCLGKDVYKKMLLKSPLELVNRAKKIKNFYDLAYGDGFANLYHPNADLSINEDEILQGLPDDNSLCIILFGNKLNDDGSMSDKFVARCKTALAMANKYPNALILVTGGHAAGWDLPAEAIVGKNWLVEHGIDENRIITEEVSWDTGSNILCSFTTSKLREHSEVTNFVVVSSDYHVPRCCFCLMSYIYAAGYDLPVSKGGRGYCFLGNLGAVIE